MLPSDAPRGAAVADVVDVVRVDGHIAPWAGPLPVGVGALSPRLARRAADASDPSRRPPPADAALIRLTITQTTASGSPRRLRLRRGAPGVLARRRRAPGERPARYRRPRDSRPRTRHALGQRQRLARGSDTLGVGVGRRRYRHVLLCPGAGRVPSPPYTLAPPPARTRRRRTGAPGPGTRQRPAAPRAPADSAAYRRARAPQRSVAELPPSTSRAPMPTA